MNFKFTRFLLLAANFILGAFFFIVGVFGVALPWSTYLQETTIQFITESSLILYLFGLTLAFIGVSIVVNAIMTSKKHLAYVHTGKHAVVLDENLIEQYLESYWEEHFPNIQIPFFLTIKKRSLLIEADLPPMEQPEQYIFLERINNDFRDIFGRILGYPHEVLLVASFKPRKDEMKVP